MSIPKVLKDHSTMIVAILGIIISFTSYIYGKGSDVTALQRDHSLMVNEVGKLDNRVIRLEQREYQLAIWQGVVVEQLKTINEKLDKLGQSK